MLSRLIISIGFVTVVLGQPTFTAHSLGNSEYHQGMISADMDNDGDIDLIAPRWTEGDAVVWYDNDGSENFTLRSIAPNHNYVQAIDVSDLDKDGDLDVLIGQGGNGTYDNTVTYAINDGSQNFTIHQVTGSQLNNSNAIKGSDIDQDGDIDIIVGWRDGIILFENISFNSDGSGNFSGSTIYGNNYSYGGEGKEIHVLDIDQDGDLDILSGHDNGENDYISWYKNDGSENFDPSPLDYAIDAMTLDAIDL